jgi:hypothetical protein
MIRTETHRDIEFKIHVNFSQSSSPKKYVIQCHVLNSWTRPTSCDDELLEESITYALNEAHNLIDEHYLINTPGVLAMRTRLKGLGFK